MGREMIRQGSIDPCQIILLNAFPVFVLNLLSKSIQVQRVGVNEVEILNASVWFLER